MSSTLISQLSHLPLRHPYFFPSLDFQNDGFSVARTKKEILTKIRKSLSLKRQNTKIIYTHIDSFSSIWTIAFSKREISEPKNKMCYFLSNLKPVNLIQAQMSLHPNINSKK